MDILTNFWQTNDLDENEMFLRDFILNEKWKDKKANELPSYEEIVAEVDEEDQELDREDEFEAKYNFRFEEPGSTAIVSYPRDVESVRKTDDKRKLQRQERAEKKKLEKTHKEEELKRIKNVKKKEIVDKLKTIQKISGNRDLPGFTEEDLEGDFDPDEFSKKMEAIFDDEYYGEDDEQYPYGADDEELNDMNRGYDNDDNEGYDEGEGEEVGGVVEGERKGKEKKKDKKGKQQDDSNDVDEYTSEDAKQETKRSLDRLLEEYYNLDYEDLIGDTPCRFKYEKVQPNSYGLNIDEILEMDDKELNQYVSLKKLYPYRSKEWYVDKKKQSKFISHLKSKRRRVNKEKEKEEKKRKRQREEQSTEMDETTTQPEENYEMEGDNTGEAWNEAEGTKRKRHKKKSKGSKKPKKSSKKKAKIE